MKWNTDIMKIVAIALMITLVLSLFVRYVMLKSGVLGSPAGNTEDEQIVEQVKALIRNGKLKENDNLPSVRSLAKELKISALTVKKAYDNLENEGFTVTIHGKGTYVTATNTELLLEEQKKELESDLERVIQKGRCYGISDEDIKKLFELILEG